MEQLDPGYLRHVYDGLVSGQIHPENPSDLPEGLIGLYEEAFDESISVVARQKNLNIFCLWALLKKEVSAAFVAEILDMSEVEINLFISKYSSWFNSPTSGKYQLYHERLKVFLLQKNSEKEIQALHDKLITRIEGAIEEKKADEWECYGLEFLAQHLSINSMLSGNGEKLMKIAYDHNFWERQLKISKGFIWTKKGLNATMIWAAKYNNDQVIECGLQMVDLYCQEQNAAPQIISLLAQGDFNAAIKIINRFGYDNPKRRFILYMLCLLELTLYSKSDFEKNKVIVDILLKKIKDLPDEYSYGDGVFSTYLVCKISCYLYRLNLDFESILKKLGYYKISLDWISFNGPYLNDEFYVLQKMVQYIDKDDKKQIVSLLLIELAKQKKIKIINSVIKNFEFDIDEDCLTKIAKALVKNNKYKESIVFAKKIKDHSNLNICLIGIVKILLEKDKVSEVYDIFSYFTMHYYRVEYACIVSDYFYLKNKNDSNYFKKLALHCLSDIQNLSWLLMAKRRIALTYINQKKYKKAFNFINETYNLKISNDKLIDFYLSSLIYKLILEKKYSYALKIAKEIKNIELKNKEIIKILLIKRKTKDELLYLTTLKNYIEQEDNKIELIKDFVDFKKYDFVFKLCRKLKHIGDIAIAFTLNGDLDLAFNLMKNYSKKIWGNPKKQIIQLLLEENRLDNIFFILDLLKKQSSSSEFLDLIEWLFNNSKISEFKSIIINSEFDKYIVNSNIKEIKKIYLDELNYKIEPTNQNEILREVSYLAFNKGSFDLLTSILKLVNDNETKKKIINLIYLNDENQAIIYIEEHPELMDDEDLIKKLAYHYLRSNEKDKFNKLLNSLPDIKDSDYDIKKFSKIDLLVYVSSILKDKYSSYEFLNHLEFVVSEIKKLEDHKYDFEKGNWFIELSEIAFESKNIEIANTLINDSINLIPRDELLCMLYPIDIITKVLYNLNRFDEAIDLIDNIKDNKKRMFYLFFLIDDIISKGQYKDLNSISNKISNNIELVKFYIYSFKAWYDINKLDKYEIYLDKVIDLIYDINDVDERYELYKDVVLALEHRCEYDKLIHFIERIPELVIKKQLAYDIGFEIASDEKQNNILNYVETNNLNINSDLRNGIMRGILNYKYKRYNVNINIIVDNLKKRNIHEETLINLIEFQVYEKIFFHKPEIIKINRIKNIFDVEWAIKFKNKINLNDKSK